jgi:hypothetical protein
MRPGERQHPLPDAEIDGVEVSCALLQAKCHPIECGHCGQPSCVLRRHLDDLIEKVENVSGFRKEIDHALERIAGIEKHLGIDKKIAA